MKDDRDRAVALRPVDCEVAQNNSMRGLRLRLVCPLGALSQYRKSSNNRFAPTAIVRRRSALADINVLANVRFA
jgi:hypothetical protein